MQTLSFKSKSTIIVIKVEWLLKPLDCLVYVFVTCFGLDRAQRSRAFLSFWIYCPIETSKKQRIVHGQGASNMKYSIVVFNFDVCQLS